MIQKTLVRTLACLLFCGALTTTLPAQQTVGLFQYDTETAEGYTLFAPLVNSSAYLLDNCGREVHRWVSTYANSSTVYLQEDGKLLKAGLIANTNFPSGGLGGRIEQLDWNGNVVWYYDISDNLQAAHHDVAPLPNGNILATVWEVHDSAEAVAEGRNPATLTDRLISEKLVEIRPLAPGLGLVVWEWRAWDHLIQDFDSTKNNYGVVADHPELFDLNYYNPTSELNWMHMNGIAFNEDLNQIAMSSHRFGEVWVIDHSTTTIEAAGHIGGNSGKGGDLLYRWGNPQTYDRGTAADQVFWGQHHVGWVPAGDQFAGMLKVFNNGLGSPRGPVSSADIWQPPVDSLGNYSISPGMPFGPATLTWTYVDSPAFYSSIVSSFQRLPGSHSLLCEGTTGHFFELDSLGNTVWSYVSPVRATGPVNQGDSIYGNTVFRATKYAPDYAGFAGQSLTPGDPLEGNPLPLPSLCEGSAVGEVVDVEGLGFAPNPFGDYLEVHGKVPARAGMEVVDVQGRVVYADDRVVAGERIHAAGWPAGIYVVRVKGTGQVVRVVKQ